MRHVIDFTRIAIVVAASGCASAPSPSSPHRTESESTSTPSAARSVVHTYSADGGGIFANSYIVETERGLVVIDGTLRVSDGKAVRAKLEALKKPLLAVLITHGHPDHYNGITEIVAGAQVPIVSTPEVARVIRDDDAAKEAQWAGTFGPEWPKQRTFPNRTLPSGESIVLDGLRFTVRGLGHGESHQDSYWLTEQGGRSIAFIGDVVLHGVHAYVSDGHTTEWLANLKRLQNDLGGIDLVYPGPGEPGGLELLDAQVRYLEHYRASVQRLAHGRPQLTAEDKKQLVLDMKQVLPNEKLEFLIGLGADSVARELAKESSSQTLAPPREATRQ